MPEYTISGRIVAPDGSPKSGATVAVLERVDLCRDATRITVTADSHGQYVARWSQAVAPPTPWDVFVQATHGTDTADSPLISDLDPERTTTVSLILGTGSYRDPSEWEQLQAKIAPLLCGKHPQDIPANRLEWLARRADVSPIHLGLFIQAHRLAHERTIRACTCYAFLRAGLPTDLPGLLEAGESAWESALRDAWAQSILPVPGRGTPAELDTRVTEAIHAMRELIVEAALTPAHGATNLRALFDAARLSEAEQREFMQAWVAHTGSLDQFWSSVRKAADFQFAIQAAAMLGNHAPALAKLTLERHAGTIATVADLATWDLCAWRSFLAKHDLGAPDDVPGDDPAQRREDYARGLTRMVEDSYPTAFLRHAIARDRTVAHTCHLATFFANNPDFDITTTTIAPYLDQAREPWRDIDPPARAVAQANLERVQRVYQMAPRLGRYDTTKALLDHGIRSAASVAAYTRSEFIESFASRMPTQHHRADALAAQVWDNASQIHTRAVALASYVGMASSGADPQPLARTRESGLRNAGKGLESLATIFNNLDYCACEHCRSVFSPAAYLADLLGFLDDRPALTQVDALGVLRRRRPDIEHILLDCANTNTALPYIDLVNELLERKLAGSLDASSYQTTWAAPELRLHPEHLDTSLYNGTSGTALADRAHPWALPFSLPVLEARLYLDHLGVTRHQLLRLLGNDSALEAAEAFGMSRSEAELVAGPAAADGRRSWGFPAATNHWVAILAGTHPGSGDIGELLRRGGFTLDELRDHLSLTFIDPNNYTWDTAINIQWAETCALSDATIANLDAAALDRLHRFTRLERRSNIPARMLNVLLDDVGGGILDASFLQALASIQALQERFGVPWDQLATWWATVIDARVYADGAPALYQRRFLAPGNETPAAFHPTSDRGDAITGAPTIGATELPTVLAATSLSTADYERIVGSELASDALSFANLARLFAVASFCRATKLPVADFLTLHSLSGVNPFSSPADALQFVELLDGIRSSSLSIAELDWLLRHEGEPLISDDAIARVLAELAAGVNTIVAEVDALVDPDGKATLANLATVVSDITEAMAIVDKSSAQAEATQAAFVDTEFASFVDTQLANVALVIGGGAIQNVEDRRAWVLQAFVGHCRKRGLLVDTAASTFNLAATAAEALLVDVLTIPGSTETLATAYDHAFATPPQITAGIDEASHPDQFRGWLRLAKAALLTARHRLNADDLRWYPGRLGAWLDLNSLPLRASDPNASFAAWDRLRAALNLRSLFRSGELGHAAVAAAPTAHDALDTLADHTGWAAHELKFIADKIGWTSAADFQDEHALSRLRAIARAGERIGVGLDVLWSWVHDEPSLAQSSAIKAAARAKYGETAWPKVAIPLRDAIRTQQRDALVAAVLATDPALSSPTQLYEQLLIDVEMSPCMLTSRVKQAISAVQMFVHRVFLRLEAKDVVFRSDAVRLWDWMKNYRVWEANRKVFLYPENWIEPQLRKHKTEQFEALEGALLQDTLDEPNVRRSLVGYLEGLDTVSNLEIAAIHSHAGVLWVLGRTQNAPRRWFLRQRPSTSQWDPWEEIPVQIDSDNVVLVSRKGRLLLFWLVIHEAKVETKTPFLDNGMNAHRLMISWAQRNEEGWGRTELSEGSEPLLWDPVVDEPDQRYMLRYRIFADDVWLHAYRLESDNSVKPFAEFRYDGRARHVDYRGSTFDPKRFPALLLPHGSLQKREWIGVQPNYRFEGQRFAKVEASEVIAEQVDLQKFAPGELPMPAATSFVQGTLRTRVFRRSPNDGYRSLLHQGDYWGQDQDKELLPVVYDDRQRKYLLEPARVFKNAGSDGNSISPAILAHLKLTAFYGCPNPPKVTRLTAKPKRRREDGVTPSLTVVPPSPEVAQMTHAATANNKFAPKLIPEPGAVALRMQALYHAHVPILLERLASRGVDGIYRPVETDPLFRQGLDADPLAWDQLDLNQKALRGPAPRENFNFDLSEPYGLYNWEIFFHIPMYIAAKLAADQRWEQAQRWYHTMFDPIEVVDLPGESPRSKFWRIKPFYEQAEDLAKNQLQAMLGINVTPKQQAAAVEAFEQEVLVWRKNPFDPHAIARIRPGVYQRAVLMRYLDNLIEWADHLFRRDSFESINEAMILYVATAQLLGPRPQAVPGPEGDAKSYSQLAAGGLDAFSNAAEQLENWTLRLQGPAGVLGCKADRREPVWVRELVVLRFWYFCYPPNPELLKFWDIIEDRMWKVRHCRNIDGVERQLPLFQPPIDPGLLVRATAAGVDLSSALAELDSGLPPYRFRSVYARADGFCADLRNLGSALLHAIEKRDGEALARIRSEHEVSLLEAVRDIRLQAIEETRCTIASLRAARAIADQRRAYFAALVEEGLTPGEEFAMTLSFASGMVRAVAQGIMAVGSILHLVPDFTATVTVPPSAGTTWGGSALGHSMRGAGEALNAYPTIMDSAASWITTNEQYQRRADEWAQQQAQAELEIARIDKDIATAEIREAIVKREFANHQLQVEQSKSVDHYLRDKFSNRELYDWMIGQLSTLYFQTYQLAFDLAKRAERAYRHELAIESGAPIIKYGYWDSLRKGLLVGEKLAHDLKRLDLAYMDHDVREFELRKSVSLARLDPAALHELQETGACEFTIPEVLFDLDHPGHVLRRIRSVSLTMPAVTDPHTTLGARLTLREHWTRRDASAELLLGHGGNDRIATSTATADAGLFNLDFRDERYLPFEYAGAVSRWKLELPDKVRQFDYRTIADVVVSIAYTAREGGDVLRNSVQTQLEARFNEAFADGAAQVFVVHQAFPDEWARFFDPGDQENEQRLTLPVEASQFPYFVRRKGFAITSVEFILWLDESIGTISDDIDLGFSVGGTQVVLTKSTDGPFAYGSTGPLNPATEPATWTLTRARTAAPSELVVDGWLDRSKLEGLLMVVRYAMNGS